MSVVKRVHIHPSFSCVCVHLCAQSAVGCVLCCRSVSCKASCEEACNTHRATTTRESSNHTPFPQHATALTPSCFMYPSRQSDKQRIRSKQRGGIPLNNKKIKASQIFSRQDRSILIHHHKIATPPTSSRKSESMVGFVALDCRPVSLFAAFRCVQ